MSDSKEKPVALITGASAGIGEAITRRMAKGGFRILAVARREEPLAKLAESLSAQTDVQTLASDVTRPDAGTQAVKTAIERFGRLDCLVNNAGSGKFAQLRKTDDAMMDELIDLTLKTPFRFIRAAVQVMKSGSSIINIGSTFGVVGGLNGGMYTAVKTGLVGLTRSAAVEFGPQGIRCNLVAPSVVRTAMIAEYWDTEVFKRVNQELTPFNRHGTPEDIANAVHFLATDEAGFINGQAISVDGGWSTTRYLSKEAILAKRVVEP